MRLTSIVLQTTLLCCSCLLPCMAGPPYDVSDPETRERHNFEIDLGYLSSHSVGEETQELPSLDLNYGYNSNLQLTLGATAISRRVFGRGRATGLGDVTLEGKWRFTGRDAPPATVWSRVCGQIADGQSLNGSVEGRRSAHGLSDLSIDAGVQFALGNEKK